MGCPWTRQPKQDQAKPLLDNLFTQGSCGTCSNRLRVYWHIGTDCKHDFSPSICALKRGLPQEPYICMYTYIHMNRYIYTYRDINIITRKRQDCEHREPQASRTFQERLYREPGQPTAGKPTTVLQQNILLNESTQRCVVAIFQELTSWCRYINIDINIYI